MDDRVLTYAELDASANRVANSLIRQGVRIGDRVALWMPKSLEAIVSIWGILKAGAAFVPVDPSAPVSRLATIARDCEIRALVTAMDRADDLHDEFGAAAPMRAVLYSGDGASPLDGAPWSSLTWNEVEAESAEPPRFTSTTTPSLSCSTLRVLRERPRAWRFRIALSSGRRSGP